MFNRLLGAILIGLIRVYQYAISPLLGPRCRFWPSCSSYGVDAVRLHGPFKGGWLALKRILKCHPWHPGGVDPVPLPRCHGHDGQRCDGHDRPTTNSRHDESR